jgi:predicted ATPase
MLKKIEVDGFKSLIDFSLALSPGLNVLIGPNGSGKSNIILFFEFLEYLLNNSAMLAISRVGGAGAIFSLISDKERRSELSFSIEGERPFQRWDSAKTKHNLSYRYEATIALTDDLTSLSFTRQYILIRNDKDSIKFEVCYDYNNHEPVNVSFKREELFLPIYISNNETDLQKLIRQYSPAFKDLSIFSALRGVVEPLSIIQQDLFRSRAFNIDPNKVRLPEDIATEPFIKSDGVGLGATLYYSEKGRQKGNRITSLNYRSNRKLKEKVERYFRLVNDNIDGIEVTCEQFYNKLRVSIIQKRENDLFVNVPIELASDGTVKWLALTTAILSSDYIFAIEEPENFLHPRMQIEIVNIVRERCSSKDQPMLSIMTTHSETLLNALQPEEVIVVGLEDGRTQARRPKNAVDLKNEISFTGFGLGYYYLSGELQ